MIGEIITFEECQILSMYVRKNRKEVIEEIEKDLRMAEDQIGWNYDYTIKDVKVT